MVRLSDAAYRDRRADTAWAGQRRARCSRSFGAIETDAFGRIFPELAAATTRLRDDELPEGIDKIDRIVVDEVQDLTVLETAVVVKLCLAIGRRRRHAPWLLAAGDDGQTVRRVSTGAR